MKIRERYQAAPGRGYVPTAAALALAGARPSNDVHLYFALPRGSRGRSGGGEDEEGASLGSGGWEGRREEGAERPASRARSDARDREDGGEVASTGSRSSSGRPDEEATSHWSSSRGSRGGGQRPAKDDAARERTSAADAQAAAAQAAAAQAAAAGEAAAPF